LNLKPKQLNLSQDLASRTPFRGVANFSPVIAKDKGKKNDFVFGWMRIYDGFAYFFSFMQSNHVINHAINRLKMALASSSLNIV
jgi:hypothetical protein